MVEKSGRARGAARRHFGIEAPRRGPGWMRLAMLASLGLGRVHRIREAARRFTDAYAVASLSLRGLRVTVDLLSADASHIPSSGPVIITANHPFGALDGLVAIAAIGRRRRDLRLLANPELTGIEGIGSIVIPVDPFGGSGATRANSSGVRQALRWLESGGALFMFPAGEVSNLQLRALAVVDRPWSATAARLMRLARVPVVPMHFAGSNSALFQIAGMVHPHLRTLLLPHELANKVGARVRVRVGKTLSAAKLAAHGSDEQIAAHLRLTTYLLGGIANEDKAGVRPGGGRALEPLAPAVVPAYIADEIAALPDDMRLVTAGRLTVYCAPAARIPWTLRELTFRAAGEGTGRAADIDLYDDYYEHLFAWNAERQEIVGAYRIGRTDVITRRLGQRGLYTSTLFEYNELFLKFLGPALELGRSFVRAEYQRGFTSLMLLWKGIGEYVGRHPEYCKLIGPVSISNLYGSLSRELLVGFLRERKLNLLAPTLVRPKRPFRGRFSLKSLGGGYSWDLEALSALVAGLEPDGKGTPVLLRQYLKLDGRVLGFNIDPEFGDALDCLILVDLRKTEPRVLQKYMSEGAWERFVQTHRGLRRAARRSA